MLKQLYDLSDRAVDSWEDDVKPFLRKHKQTIITLAVVGATSYLGAVVGVKHTKIEVNLVPREGTVIPLKVVDNPYN